MVTNLGIIDVWLEPVPEVCRWLTIPVCVYVRKRERERREGGGGGGETKREGMGRSSNNIVPKILLPT